MLRQQPALLPFAADKITAQVGNPGSTHVAQCWSWSGFQVVDPFSRWKIS